MGLDLVMFTMAVEHAFGVYIPNADAARLVTPGALVDYLQERLGNGTQSGCLEQRAFYRLRQAGMRVFGRPRDAFQPSTPWFDILQAGRYSEQWELLGEATGISPWPRLAPLWSFGRPTQTVGETARRLAIATPGQLMRDGEGWERARIEAVVRRLMAEELGVTTFQWSDRFVQDLRCN